MLSPCRFTISIFFILIFQIGFSQTSESELREFIKTAKSDELIQRNNEYLLNEEYFFADIIATQLISFEPENSNFNYRKGYSTMNLNNSFETAIPFLENAILDIDNKYDMYSSKEKSAPADAYLYLGKCYHQNEELDKAENYYKKFLNNSRKGSNSIEQAKLYLLQCQYARFKMANPVNVELKNVGTTINTAYPEYSPVISLDGSSLYFTSRRKWNDDLPKDSLNSEYTRYGEDIYVSYLDLDMTWTQPERLLFCLPERNEATIAVSIDERRIHLYQDNQGNGDIYYADFYSAKFNEIQPLDISGINSKYWETHCMMTHDQKRLYFVSDRAGGFGGRDIYYVDRKEDDTWSEPINMGPNINTKYDEDSPFISVDNKTLYLATNGEKSIGGFDIVRSVLHEDGTWSPIENLGYPFNSTNDDIYYTTTIDGFKGFMTSSRKGGKGEKDIYEIHNEYLGVQSYAVLKGKIDTYNDEMLAEDVALKVEVVCPDCDQKQSRLVYPRLRDGFFLSYLERCKTYYIYYSNLTEGVLVATDSFSTSCDTSFQEIVKNFMLDENGNMNLIDPIVEVDSNFIIDPIVFDNPSFTKYFGFNEYKLSNKSLDLTSFLDSLENQIDNGRKEVTIYIYSSASKVPTSTFASNKDLTEKRAQNMKDMLNEVLALKPAYSDKINVSIVESVVQGPDYKGDFRNKERYGNFQYIRLETE